MLWPCCDRKRKWTFLLFSPPALPFVTSDSWRHFASIKCDAELLLLVFVTFGGYTTSTSLSTSQTRFRLPSRTQLTRGFRSKTIVLNGWTDSRRDIWSPERKLIKQHSATLQCCVVQCMLFFLYSNVCRIRKCFLFHRNRIHFALCNSQMYANWKV